MAKAHSCEEILPEVQPPTLSSVHELFRRVTTGDRQQTERRIVTICVQFYGQRMAKVQSDKELLQKASTP